MSFDSDGPNNRTEDTPGSVVALPDSSILVAGAFESRLDNTQVTLLGVA